MFADRDYLDFTSTTTTVWKQVCASTSRRGRPGRRWYPWLPGISCRPDSIRSDRRRAGDGEGRQGCREGRGGRQEAEESRQLRRLPQAAQMSERAPGARSRPIRTVCAASLPLFVLQSACGRAQAAVKGFAPSARAAEPGFEGGLRAVPDKLLQTLPVGRLATAGAPSSVRKVPDYRNGYNFFWITALDPSWQLVILRASHSSKCGKNGSPAGVMPDRRDARAARGRGKMPCVSGWP
jgi:hypothetical protein